MSTIRRLGVVAAFVVACGPKPPAGTPIGTSQTVTVEARELGKVDPTACSTAGFVQQMGATCHEVRSRNARGGKAQATASTANDGDACTVWNAGGTPPQMITVDLEKDSAVSGLLLIPDMTPPEGDVLHVVEQSNDGDVWSAVVSVQRHMVDDHVYAVSFPQKVTTHFLRVTTSASPSWVAWAEVAPILCN